MVNWNAIRLFLILVAQLELSSTQVDYAAAFTHAPIPKPVGYDKMSPEDQQKHDTYVELPRGFKQNHPGCVLKLKKNLYGSKSAPRNWFHHLRDNLKKVGLEQQIDVDPCSFLSDKVTCHGN